jgi:carbamoyl-phosphate synthase large subunit
MVSLATRVILGGKLRDMGYGSGLYPERDIVAVKVPVFSFEKLQDVDTQLGPEMKSTGEVLGIAKRFDEALLKGLLAAGYKMKKSGGVLVSLRDSDKNEALDLIARFEDMGFDIYATGGTANALNTNMIAANAVAKVGEGEPNIMTLLESGKIDYVISTASKGRKPARDGVRIRRKAVERSIVCLTSLDTTRALLDCREMKRGIENIDLVDIVKLR